MAFDFHPFLRTTATALLCALSGAAGPVRADDYVGDMVPSAISKAYFAAIPDHLPMNAVVLGKPQDRGEKDAFYTEDGSISIPPGGMVVFSLAGKCMDPHLPAPSEGEPMQFVDLDRLIPPALRVLYDNLIERMAKGDRKVLANNPQHLVWAIRTAGTEDPLANSLSDAQLEVLDECAGRRGAFLRFHEKEKRRNARKNRRGTSRGTGRVTVGALSYDASELSGTNGSQRIESHIAELTEMGRNSRIRTAADFRYGEMEEELYSDVVCEGGLSFKARILNTSRRRREFRAADFAAQVGNGSLDGGKRQRVTMEPPSMFVFVAGAAQEGVEQTIDTTEMELSEESGYRVRGQTYRRRTVRGAEAHIGSETEESTRRRTRRDERTIVTGIPPVAPVPPVEPVEPVVIVETNTVVQTRYASEKLSVRVVSLEFDPDTGRGTLVVEIVRGTFREATKHIRDGIGALVREGAQRLPDASAIPQEGPFAVESISIREDDLCEVRFAVHTEEETPQ